MMNHLLVLVVTCFIASPATGMPVFAKPEPGPAYITTRNTTAYILGRTSDYTGMMQCPMFVNYNTTAEPQPQMVAPQAGCGCTSDLEFVLNFGNDAATFVPGCPWPKPHCPAGFTMVDTQTLSEPYGTCYAVCVTTAVCKSL